MTHLILSKVSEHAKRSQELASPFILFCKYPINKNYSPKMKKAFPLFSKKDFHLPSPRGFAHFIISITWTLASPDKRGILPIATWNFPVK